MRSGIELLYGLGLAGCFTKPLAPSSDGGGGDVQCSMPADFASQLVACEPWGMASIQAGSTMTPNGAGLDIQLASNGTAACRAYSARDVSAGVEVEIVDPTEAAVLFKLSTPRFAGEFGMRLDGGKLGMFFDTMPPFFERTYIPTTMRWWRLRVTSSMLHAEYRAADGPYVALGEIALPMALGAETFVLFDARAAADPGSVVVRNLTYCP